MKMILRAFLAITSLSVVASADAAVIVSEGNTAPNTNILASQLTDSSGALKPNNDYTDNAGPPGETFTVAQNSLLEDITVLGGNDAGPTLAGLHLMIGSVDPSTGLVTPLNGTLGSGGGELAPTPANPNDYVTYQLGSPISLTAGAEYVFGLYSDTAWYGIAHSAPGSAAGAVNFNDTDTLESDNSGRPSKNGGFGQFAVTNTGDYQYVFAAQGVVVVPEPASIALFGLGAIGLLLAARRRD